MPLDHYIPQVYLRNFYSPLLGERLYAIRKSDLKFFTPNSKAVCAINDGSTNAYLKKNREVEDFLATLEPKFNEALRKFETSAIDNEAVYVVAGLAAFIATCSPAAMRLFSGPLKATVEAEAKILEAQGLIPQPPPALQGTSLTELLQKGSVKIDIDSKYPQALGITNILEMTKTLGGFMWEVLKNDHPDAQFFTSDYPIAIEATPDPRVLNKIFPLSPSIAVRIKPNLQLDKEKTDLSFANFSCRYQKISRKESTALNRLLVRCAEDLVIWRDNHDWIKSFVAKNKRFRIETITDTLETDRGVLLISRQRIASMPDISSQRGN
jgi:hypothetical protein